MKVELVAGDIAYQMVDILVNSTTKDLNLSSGPVTKAILKAGGDNLQTECRAAFPDGIEFGEICQTSGGALNSVAVYHTALPQWTDGADQNLRDLITLCLAAADGEGSVSIAFPALGTGNLKYPPETVADTFFSTVGDFDGSSLQLVKIVVYPKDNAVIQAFNDARRNYETQLEISGTLTVNKPFPKLLSSQGGPNTGFSYGTPRTGAATGSGFYFGTPASSAAATTASTGGGFRFGGTTTPATGGLFATPTRTPAAGTGFAVGGAGTTQPAAAGGFTLGGAQAYPAAPTSRGFRLAWAQTATPGVFSFGGTTPAATAVTTQTTAPAPAARGFSFVGTATIAAATTTTSAPAPGGILFGGGSAVGGGVAAGGFAGLNKRAVVIVSLVTSDLTQQQTDVIVNTTNPNLNLKDGTVSKAILEAAGDELQTWCTQSYPSGIKVGDVAVTKGGNLACKHVYHITLSETWATNQSQTEQDVKDIMLKLLKTADDAGLSSLSMPALGTGKLKYDPARIAQIMYNAAFGFQARTLNKVIFVVHSSNPDVIQAFKAASSRRRKARQAKKPQYPSLLRTIGQVSSIKIRMVRGSIEDQKVDVLVNSTAPDLNLSHGPLSKAILKRAGTGVQDECKQGYPNGIKVDEIAVTSGGNLGSQGVKQIYHTTLTKWKEGNQDIEKSFRDLIYNCLKTAAQNLQMSIAIPFLGTGGLKYPEESTAQPLQKNLQCYNSLATLLQCFFSEQDIT